MENDRMITLCDFKTKEMTCGCAYPTSPTEGQLHFNGGGQGIVEVYNEDQGNWLDYCLPICSTIRVSCDNSCTSSSYDGDYLLELVSCNPQVWTEVEEVGVESFDACTSTTEITEINPETDHALYLRKNTDGSCMLVYRIGEVEEPEPEVPIVIEERTCLELWEGADGLFNQSYYEGTFAGMPRLGDNIAEAWGIDAMTWYDEGGGHPAFNKEGFKQAFPTNDAKGMPQLLDAAQVEGSTYEMVKQEPDQYVNTLERTDFSVSNAQIWVTSGLLLLPCETSTRFQLKSADSNLACESLVSISINERKAIPDADHLVHYKRASVIGSGVGEDSPNWIPPMVQEESPIITINENDKVFINYILFDPYQYIRSTNLLIRFPDGANEWVTITSVQDLADAGLYVQSLT